MSDTSLSGSSNGVHIRNPSLPPPLSLSLSLFGEGLPADVRAPEESLRENHRCQQAFSQALVKFCP